MLLASKQDNVTDEKRFKEVKPHVDALMDFMNLEIKSFEPEIRELVEYCLKLRGKKIRPMLVFFSGWKDNPEPQAEIIKVAAILEMVHQATLVHDDILDGASIRHNSPTTSEKYNAHVAVLLGDALFSHALQLASEFPTVEVCKIVSLATRRVCAGEISQSLQTDNINITQKEYYRIIDLKTAELFGASCKLGASLAGYSPEYVSAAAAFGRHLGIAYQIFDDLSDLIDHESNTGKTLGTDLASCKYTLPIILLLNKLGDSDRNALSEELSKGTKTAKALISQLHDHEVINDVIEAFNLEINLAEEAISEYSNLPPYAHLMSSSKQIRELINRLN